MPNPMTGSSTVHEAIGAVVSELGGIGKNQRNKDQGYNFRGIDDVLKEVHPLLAKHGVFFAPNVLEREYEERVSKQGNIGHVAHLHVQYKVYGPSGDFIEMSTWGEGLDYSDKATNKAMTAAFKYALFELFAIADPSEDADGETPEGTAIPNEQPDREAQYRRPPREVQTPQGEEVDARIAVILEAAELGESDFLTDLGMKYTQYGNLTEKQLEAGFRTAHKILGNA